MGGGASRQGGSAEEATAKRKVKGVVEFRVDAEPVKLDFAKVKAFQELPQHNKVIAEYVWIDSEYTDGKSFDLCSKSMTLDSAPNKPEDLPEWAYSGSDDTDVQLVARRIYKDPFRGGDNILVLADTYEQPDATAGDGSCGPPKGFNSRHTCEDAMQRALRTGEDPWFGIEQEYYLLNVETDWPLGWPPGKLPGKHDGYYCAVGASKAVGRDVVEAHYKACIYAGVKLGGVNSEVAPGQWEFQVGPCSGTAAADDLWMARYILQRLCEIFHIGITFDPKPVDGWAGIGCHTNYSTNGTRAHGGMEVIKEHCELLRARHFDHIAHYGRGNKRRLSGEDDTAHIADFSWGVADRSASIRIGARVAARGCGYYEDRRPASNMDPYSVCRLLVETTLLGEKPRLERLTTKAGDFTAEAWSKPDSPSPIKEISEPNSPTQQTKIEEFVPGQVHLD